MSTSQSNMKSTRYDLYYAAVDADDRFHSELVRVYGRANAGDARYYRTHTDAAVIAAREAKHAADKAWLADMHGQEICPTERERIEMCSADPVRNEELGL